MTETLLPPPPDNPSVATASADGDDPLGRAISQAIDDASRLLGAIRRATAEYDLTTSERARTLTRLEDYAGDLHALLEWVEGENE